MAYVEYVAENLGAIGKRPTNTISARNTNLEISKDVGCQDISDSCLKCPLSQCIEDYPAEHRAMIRQRFREWKLRQQQA